MSFWENLYLPSDSQLCETGNRAENRISARDDEIQNNSIHKKRLRGPLWLEPPNYHRLLRSIGNLSPWACLPFLLSLPTVRLIYFWHFPKALSCKMFTLALNSGGSSALMWNKYLVHSLAPYIHLISVLEAVKTPHLWQNRDIEDQFYFARDNQLQGLEMPALCEGGLDWIPALQGSLSTAKTKFWAPGLQ